jgi:hypothetical protein
LPSGRAVHFDGFHSPNVKLGKTRWSYIYTFEDYRAGLEASHGQQTIQLWSQDRGFWSPAGVLNTVFDEVMVARYDGTGTFTWQTSSEPIAALDPAFGGDACRLQFGLMGDLPTGRYGIQLTDRMNIHGDPTSKEVLDFQIARKTILECEKRGVKPDHFACDATGTGRGVYAILKQEWSDAVVRVEFGGSPSDRPSSADDSRPGTEVYDRRVTQLWFLCRDLLISEQLKGLFPEAIVEFCSREFTIKTRKLCLATKDETKKAIGRSPDAADSIAILCDLAASLGVVPGTYERQSTQWDDIAKRYDEINNENDVATSSPVEMMEEVE